MKKLTGVARARLIGALLLAFSLPAQASNVLSDVWLTEERDATIEIRPCGDQLCGYIHSILKVYDPDLPLNDNRNEKPELRARRLCGLAVIGGLQKQSPANWIDGWVYDPKVGKTYSLNITLQDENTLAVRAYVGIGIFGRTLIWTRASPSVAKCK